MRYITLFFLMVAAVGAVIRWWRTRHSAAWPACDGTVFKYDVLQEGNRNVAIMMYSYSAMGEFYSGIVRLGSQKKADAYAEQFPSGTKLIIRYNPANPEISAMRRDDQPLISYRPLVKT